MKKITGGQTAPLPSLQSLKAPGSTGNLQPMVKSTSKPLIDNNALTGGLSALRSAASPAVPRLSANDLGVVPQGQGGTNACGTTSLAMLLTYWGKPTDHVKIDQAIRRMDMPTSPDDVVRYAESQGMRRR
jgi:hypothetical protein